jgi:hypothetical protein
MTGDKFMTREIEDAIGENVTALRPIGDPGKPLDWLAKALWAKMRNGNDQSVAIYVSREDAQTLARMIDEANGDADRTG